MVGGVHGQLGLHVQGHAAAVREPDSVLAIILHLRMAEVVVLVTAVINKPVLILQAAQVRYMK